MAKHVEIISLGKEYIKDAVYISKILKNASIMINNDNCCLRENMDLESNPNKTKTTI